MFREIQLAGNSKAMVPAALWEIEMDVAGDRNSDIDSYRYIDHYVYACLYIGV